MMKHRLLSILVLISFLAASCGQALPDPTEEAASTNTPALPTAKVDITSAPDVEEAALSFLDAWEMERYDLMYEMLSGLSKDATTLEEFDERYTATSLALALSGLDCELLSVLTGPENSQAAYRVTFHSALIEEYTTSEILMDMTLEDGEWKVVWHDGLIMPQLSGGNRLRADISVPARGNIYDINGDAIVAQTDAYAIGIEPGKIQNEGKMLSELSRLTGRSTDEIAKLYEFAGPDWYIPVGDAPAEAVEARMDTLINVGGLWLNDYNSRYYYGSGLATQTIGYTLAIPVEQLDAYRQEGYIGTEQVGMSGVEKGSEEELRGVRGSDVYVVNPDGQVIDRLGHADARPALSVTTTLDSDFQAQVERALSGFVGAAVVLERDTGKVLAMASSPTFNPNLFNPNNYNRGYLLNDVLTNENQPTLNRATQSGYPLGSVFKIITMAAALESELYQADTSYYCGHEFTELPGQVFYDWTFDHEIAPSGELTLQEGLMRSCNPYFYHIGLDLYQQNFPTAVSDMAVAFGLGKQTGIGQLDEEDGNVPVPASEGDAIQLAIGQGTLQVTPLQVAAFIAAMGNGGTIYRPQVVDHYVDAGGEVVEPFTPEVNGTLPLSAENLDIIREAMRWVVNEPRGTAYGTFWGLGLPVYGKTGTAQTSREEPHSWFAGYSDAKIMGQPDIAVVVIAEFAGEGSEIAAPIFRRIMEIYFEGQPRKLYPWETRMYVTQTNTPDEFERTQTAVAKSTEEAEIKATNDAATATEEAKNND
ncbi:MAG: hypothetical protein JW750_04985 [Anaerolineaceae bacterium]|nr:hypothetical protein [Anaerolineaceae bacterium]